MSWKKYIHADKKILVGKPVVKGTRLAVDFILGLLAEGWTTQQILENYPSLTHDSLCAVFNFSAECMREEIMYEIMSQDG